MIVIFSSFHELIQWRGVRLLSVCPSVNFFAQIILLRDKWLDCDQTCTWQSPGERASRVCSRSRSKVTRYGHFVMSRKSLLLTGNVWIATKLAHDDLHGRFQLRWHLMSNECIAYQAPASTGGTELVPGERTVSSLCEFCNSSQFTYR